MDSPSLDILLREILEQAKAVDFSLQSVNRVEHGFGWEPTLEFGHDDRRVHFYFSFYNMDQLMVEVSRETYDSASVRRAVISTTEDAWLVVDSFLRNGCALDELPKKFEWEHAARGDKS